MVLGELLVRAREDHMGRSAPNEPDISEATHIGDERTLIEARDFLHYEMGSGHQLADCIRGQARSG
jgi:hypothetical protein